MLGQFLRILQIVCQIACIPRPVRGWRHQDREHVLEAAQPVRSVGHGGGQGSFLIFIFVFISFLILFLEGLRRCRLRTYVYDCWHACIQGFVLEDAWCDFGRGSSPFRSKQNWSFFFRADFSSCQCQNSVGGGGGDFSVPRMIVGWFLCRAL